MADSLYGAEQARGVWVWLEHDGELLASVSLELLAKGRELADKAGEPLTGFILGHEAGSLAEEALSRGVDEIVLGENPLLKNYTTDLYCAAAAEAVLKHKPNLLLLGATPDGRDLAGRLAVRLRTGLTADCTNMEMKPEDPSLLLSEVTGFGGGIAAIIACLRHRPQMATVRPGVFLAAAPAKKPGAALRRFSPGLEGVPRRAEIVERSIGAEVDITKAKFMVIGGRGIRGEFGLLMELAGLMGAEIGASRVAVDEGWIGKEHMVGQTGFVTRPKLALICGVSGALQFTVGVASAETVVAINLDRSAPIFESADYCVAQDLFKVLPPLIKELRNSK